MKIDTSNDLGLYKYQNDNDLKTDSDWDLNNGNIKIRKAQTVGDFKE